MQTFSLLDVVNKLQSPKVFLDPVVQFRRQKLIIFVFLSGRNVKNILPGFTT